MGTEKVRNAEILSSVVPRVLSPREGGPVFSRQGHQVLPGVFSIRPKGLGEDRMHPAHEAYPPAHFPHPGDKLEPSVFPPRSAGMVVPPPLVGNKHGEPEHGYPPHFPPHPFYQQGMEPPGLTQHEIEMRNFESWRQRRKIDHIRQQEERMTVHPGDKEHHNDMHHLPSDIPHQSHQSYAENKYKMKDHENHLSKDHTPRERTEPKSPLRDHHQNSSQDKDVVIVDAKGSASSRGQMPVIHSVYYYNEPKSSCPVHGGPASTAQSTPKGGTSPRVVSAGEYLHNRSGEAENMHHGHHHHSIMSSEKQHHSFVNPDKHHSGFLPPEKHPFHPMPVPGQLGRDAPMYYRHPLDKTVELDENQRREEQWMMETRMILEQKHRMKLEEEEWQRRQAHARQEKHDHRDSLQYREHLLHQKDMEKRESFGSNSEDKDRDQRHHIQALPPESYRVRELDFRSDPRHQFENMHPHLPRDFHGRPFGSHLGLPIEPHPGMHHMEALRGMTSPQRHDYYYGAGYGGYFPPHAPSRPLSLFEQEQFRRSLAAIERPNVSEWFSASKHPFTNGEASVSSESSVKPSDRSSIVPSSSEHPPVVIKEEKPEEPPQSENNKNVINNHVMIEKDPKKVKFLQGLGLITLDEMRDKNTSVPTLKRPSEEDLEDLLSGKPAKQPKEKKSENKDDEGEESSEEGIGTDAESSTDSLDGELVPKDSEEKLIFMAHLGLVPPKRKRELEVDIERKREERRLKKTRGRPKKGRKEDKKDERSRTPYDVDFLTGPMTRQKQQLMQEQGLILEELQKTRSSSTTPSENGDASRHDSGRDSSNSVTIKQEKLDKDDRYSHNSSLSMHPSPPSQAYSQNLPRPQLTLQSLTNMEDPFNNFNNSFRPPYLRHTGLLSLKEQGKHNSHNSSTEQSKVFTPVSEAHRNSSPHSSNRPSSGLLGLRPVPSLQEDFMQTFASTHAQAAQESGFRNVMSGSHDQQHRHSAFKSYNNTGVQLGSGVKETHCTQTTPSIRENKGTFKWPGIEAIMNSYLAYSEECNLELDVLHDSMETLRGRHNSLNDQAEKLNHRMTGLAQLKRTLSEEGKMLREKLDSLHSCLQNFKKGIPLQRKDL